MRLRAGHEYRGSMRVVANPLALLAMLASSHLLAQPALQPADQDDPRQLLLERWQIALRHSNYDSYLNCLYSRTRKVPEYGSKEALEFWAEELDELASTGFEGKFQFETVDGDGVRFPDGAVRAYPIVSGRSLTEAIVLIQEEGHWKILRLFS